jgi:hypothetical protein
MIVAVGMQIAIRTKGGSWHGFGIEASEGCDPV